MFDKQYFFGFGKIDKATMMVESKFSRDLISFVEQGYLIDFFNKLPENDFQLPIMNARIKGYDLLYLEYGQCVETMTGVVFDVDDEIKYAYLGVYGILQNLCINSVYEDEPNSTDRYITANFDIINVLISEKKIVLSDEEIQNYKEFLTLTKDYVVDGMIPVVSFYKISEDEYVISKDFFDVEIFANHFEVLTPVHLASVFMKVLIHILFNNKRVRITYFDGNDVRVLDTTLILSIDEDCCVNSHCLYLFNMDAYKTGSSENVFIDIFTIIDIKILE